MLDRMRVERSKLVFMGLVALKEIEEHCIHQPWHRAFTLRVTLATLYAFSDGDRGPFDAFWRACALPNETGCEQHRSRLTRANEVTIAYNRICRALGVAQTINFCADIAAALRDPNAYGSREVRRLGQDESDIARQRFAEMLRATGKATAEEKERRRLARECPLRG